MKRGMFLYSYSLEGTELDGHIAVERTGEDTIDVTISAINPSALFATASLTREEANQLSDWLMQAIHERSNHAEA